MKPSASPRAFVAAAAITILVTGGSIAGALALSDKAVSGEPASAGQADSLRADFIQRVTEIGQTDLAPAVGSKFETLKASLNGAEWSLSSYRNTKGELCMLEVVPGEGRGYGCWPGLFDSGPLVVNWGSRQNPENPVEGRWDEAWVDGFAGSPIARVELVMTDCTSIELPLTSEGAFFGVVGETVMDAGVSPYLARGLDTKGRVVATDVAKFGPATAKEGFAGSAEAVKPSGPC